MKLIRFGEAGGEGPGVLLDDDSCLDVSDFVPDYDETFFARDGTEALRDWLKTHLSLAPRVPSTIMAYFSCFRRPLLKKEIPVRNSQVGTNWVDGRNTWEG